MQRFLRMQTFFKLLFLSTLTFAAACSKNSPDSNTPQGTEGGSAASVTEAGACKAGGSPQTEGAACGATYEGCCYPDAAAACAAAGCAEGCVQAESMPVQVSCPGGTAPAGEGTTDPNSPTSTTPSSPQ